MIFFKEKIGLINECSKAPQVLVLRPAACHGSHCLQISPDVKSGNERLERLVIVSWPRCDRIAEWDSRLWDSHEPVPKKGRSMLHFESCPQLSELICKRTVEKQSSRICRKQISSHTFLSLANGFETCWPNARGNQILAKVHHFVLPLSFPPLFLPLPQWPENSLTSHWLVPFFWPSVGNICTGRMVQRH